ncbi:MAG: ribulose-bisphosphate carboxylase large subunit family protein [Planctomycetales bacterium]|nr:ribulose-bisphosphate carboxylase large subunit family protein [Planctomycetales bacterium]
MQRLVATYLIETPGEAAAAAAALAGEQSSGTFVAVPGETEALKARFAARVESVEPLEAVEQPSLPGSRASETGRYQRAIVRVSWSIENFGANLPAIVSTVQGNLYELPHFSGLRLLDLDFPSSFADEFVGPRFGVAGTRRLCGVSDRPLIGTIIKPSVGMSPADTAALVGQLAAAGVDFVKDDELMADPPHSPLAERVERVMRVVNDHFDRTGKRVMVAFNVTDELDRMLAHYDTVVRHGGTCVMVSLNSVGLAGVKKVCDQGAVPVHGHRNGWGMLTRHPALGMDFTAYQKLWRLAGVDQIHVNGLQNKFWEPDDSVVRSIAACREPLLGGLEVLPVVSSGQWGGQAPETYRRTQTTDLLYMAGGGILAHPDGPAAGVAALHEAWEAAAAGLTLQQAIGEYPALRRAAEKFAKLTPAPQEERAPEAALR